MSADSSRISRRQILRLGALAGFGGGLLTPAASALTAMRRPAARADACIIVWLDGGPSHLETFDPKPEAPSEYRGDFGTVASSLDGTRICEHLPRLAAQLDSYALLRSLTSREGNHDRGSHHYMTGYHPSPAVVYPSLGAVAARQLGLGADGVPTYVSLLGAPGSSGAGYLGPRFDPYVTGVGASRGQGGAGLSDERLLRRRAMRRLVTEAGPSSEPSATDSFFEQAFDLVASESARAAFDLERESQALRDRYGHFPLGEACLTARRLVEAGSRVVTVTHKGWDTHEDGFRRLISGYPGPLPELDQALSALVEDLGQRGALERTLVLCLGEFGRTPKINAKAGRDHWPRANSVLVAGGGARTGQVIGATDARGELPVERPIEPGELLATVYHLLGLDSSATYRTADGRELRVLEQGLRPIQELL